MIENGFVYTHDSSNIHHIVLQDVRQPTINAFAVQLKEIVKDTPTTDLIRLLLVAPGVPPIQQMVAHVQDIKATYPKRALARIALVYSPSIQLSFLDIITRSIVRSSTLMLFPQKDEAKAYQWLLQ